VGLGTERDLGQAAAKSTREWLGLVNSHRLMGGACPPDRFEAGEENIFAVHHTYSMQPGVGALIDHLTSGKETPTKIPYLNNGLWESTRFNQLKTRSPRHAVVISDNPDLLPLYFTERFFLERARYLENARLKKAIPERFRFHPQDRFLAHPLN
jgi:hypothetical protein